MKIWTVYGNSERTEGRGHNIPRLRFTNEQAAIDASEHPTVCREYGVMGHGPLEVREEEVFDSLADVPTFMGEI